MIIEAIKQCTTRSTKKLDKIALKRPEATRRLSCNSSCIHRLNYYFNIYSMNLRPRKRWLLRMILKPFCFLLFSLFWCSSVSLLFFCRTGSVFFTPLGGCSFRESVAIVNHIMQLLSAPTLESLYRLIAFLYSKSESRWL